MKERLLTLSGLLLLTLSGLTQLALSGCSSGHSRRLNILPMERYAAELVRASGASLSVRGCDMFGDSRRGYCILEGEVDQLSAFASGLTMHAITGEDVVSYGQSCLQLVEFGSVMASGHSWAPKAGVSPMNPPPHPPPNRNNVHVRRSFVGPASICVEMEYPYG